MESSKKERIIVVDLDGTLIKTDVLLESLFLFLRNFYFRIFEILKHLLLGKARLKLFLYDNLQLDVTALPYNHALLDWLVIQKRMGAKLVLATASDQRIANKIANHLCIFDEVIGTTDVNLSSNNKRDTLVKRFGLNNFEYIGNSKADLPVWRSSSVIHVVNPEAGVLGAISGIGEIQTYFRDETPYFYSLTKSLRLHQWAKNFLLFLPLLAAHRLLEIYSLTKTLIAFLAFGFCASSVYLLNDLLDLSDDRKHSSKKNRPLAAGDFPIKHAVHLIPALLLLGFGLSVTLLPFNFTFILLIYYFLTLNYSLWIKRQVMLDVITLAVLYTLRVLAGASATELIATSWMISFCMFIFLSLAFVKRYTELRDARVGGNNTKASGRGYYPADFELLASLGGASSYISVLVLALYINDTSSLAVYKTYEWMWLACPILLFWLSRLWLLAHRGEMHDDPVVFALRDKTSRLVGVLFLLVFFLAAY